MSHIRNVACKEFHIRTNQTRVRRKNAAAKALTISPKGGPRFGSKKRARWGSVFYVDIARYSFSNMEPKKGSIFPPQNCGFFLLFFCCCYCTFAPEGLVNFYSYNSGRPTVLIVGSWFVWLLNDRPALHTGRIRFTYSTLKAVLKPISWNHQKALFGPQNHVRLMVLLDQIIQSL